MDIFVSVIIPIYKVEQYLERCINSIINQTYTKLEIILVDDGSPDNSGKICDMFAKRDDRIKVIHKENGGLSDARNAGIRVSTGKYILFVDSDDYIEVNGVEELITVAEKYSLDIVSANAFEEHQNRIQKLIFSNITQNQVMSGIEYMSTCISVSNFAAAVCIRLYRTNLIKENQLYFVNGILHEDENWTPKVMLYTKSMMHIDSCFYHYIIRENSITQSTNKEKNIRDICNTCKELEHLYRGTTLNEKQKKLFLDYLSRIYMATCCLGKYNNRFYSAIIDKKFVLKNASYVSTRIKAIVYCISIQLYRSIKMLSSKEQKKC